MNLAYFNLVTSPVVSRCFKAVLSCRIVKFVSLDNTSIATQDINHNNRYDNIDYGYVPPNKKF